MVEIIMALRGAFVDFFFAIRSLHSKRSSTQVLTRQGKSDARQFSCMV